MRVLIDFEKSIGMKYSKWTVLGMAQDLKKSYKTLKVFNCQCDCGTTRAVIAKDVLRGKSLSCGCIRMERFKPKTVTTEYLKSRSFIDENGCWLLDYNKNPEKFNRNRYPRVMHEGKRYIATRLSWILFHGELDSETMICHKCDVPACVNPDHLFAGTASDNMRDMWQKNRHSREALTRPGGIAGKLTLDQVRAIRQLIDEGKKAKEIAGVFNVSQSSIVEIRNGTKWSKHV